MRKIRDLTGQEYYDLLVLCVTDKRTKTGGVIWVCMCSCGNRLEVSSSSLVYGNTKSCGCRKEKSTIENGRNNKKDRVGERIGKLVVIVDSRKRTSSGDIIWRCQCDCGKTVDIIGNNLGRNTKSCSCEKVKHGMWKTSEYRQWMKIRRREKEKALDCTWKLSMQRAIKTFFDSCVICGNKESLSVDHIDSLHYGNGLWIDNAIVLCRSCNSSKHTKGLVDFDVDTRRKIIDASCEFQDYWEIEWAYQ